MLLLEEVTVVVLGGEVEEGGETEGVFDAVVGEAAWAASPAMQMRSRA